MKLLMLIYSGPKLHRLSALLDAHHVNGYTEIHNAHGVGESGRLLGTRAWPGSSTVLLTVVPPSRAAELINALHVEQTLLSEGEHLHVAVLPVESYF